MTKIFFLEQRNNESLLSSLEECDKCDEMNLNKPSFLESCASFIGMDISANTSVAPKYSVTKEIEEFRLPIAYLDASSLFLLNETVAADLELTATSIDSTEEGEDGSLSRLGMYDFFMYPSHSFAKELIPSWKKQYTTNISFLTETQSILSEMDKFSRLKNSTETSESCWNKTNLPKYILNTEKITEIWGLLKKDDYFLEKYGFLEWDWEIAQNLNNSVPFLQFMSLMNIISPAMSLLTPFFLLLFPFLLLKIQNIPISFETYLNTLKDIARHHFIGKTLLGLNSISWENVIYLFFTVGLYGLQIYQNTTACFRFYRNMKKVNDTLLELQNYSRYSLTTMENFAEIIQKYNTYTPFYQVLCEHIETMKRISTEIQKVTPFSHSVDKILDFGYMLKCFYQLHKNSKYDACLRFSIGFEAYIDNMCGIHRNLAEGKLAPAIFSGGGESTEDVETDTEEEENEEEEDTTSISSREQKKTKIALILKEQYYPALINESPIKNDCCFGKNMILSAPNKAGKTTILKTSAINIIFTQQFGVGFYSSAIMHRPYTHLHSYLNIPDTSGRDSLFQAESRRCKEILDSIQENPNGMHFCIFDELYSGTNPEEACTAGCAFLKYLCSFSNVDFILTTHYIDICKQFKHSKSTRNYKMEVNVLDNGLFDYTYQMKPGISKIKGAIRVLRDMNYPDEILNNI